MEIYAENLILINFSSLFVCLTAPCRAYAVSIRRQAAAAALGAAFALIAFACGGTAQIAAEAAGFAAVSAAAFGKRAGAWIMFFVTLLLVYALAAMLVSWFGSGAGAFMSGGVIYFNVQPKLFIPLFGVSLALAAVLQKRSRQNKALRRHRLRISKNGKCADFTALYDSGNLLKEPRSGRSVILVSRSAAKPLEPDKLITDEPPLVIPYRSLGHSGVLLGFCADKIILDNKKEIYGAVIAFSDRGFAEGCDALIGGI